MKTINNFIEETVDTGSVKTGSVQTAKKYVGTDNIYVVIINNCTKTVNKLSFCFSSFLN